MTHFVLFYDYHPDYLSLRAPHRAAHLELAQASAARDELQLGGALPGEPPLGLLLFKGQTAEVAERFAQADPYVVHGVALSYRVREWTTVVGKDALTTLA